MDELLIEPEPTERELGTAPIKPLFARYAAITFAGMLAQMVMVVLEGLIIGNGLGPLGLAAVTVILPLELLNLALGGALGMGTAAAAGQRRGQRRLLVGAQQRAQQLPQRAERVEAHEQADERRHVLVDVGRGAQKRGYLWREQGDDRGKRH